MINPEHTSVQTEKTLGKRLLSGELLFLGNCVASATSIVSEDERYIRELREQYSPQSVVISDAMNRETGHPSGMPDMRGIYVDAARYAELHPYTLK
jgi:hypothetical protein